MTQNDLDNGRLICLIGVAPTKPAEFVIFRIGQWTADRRDSVELNADDRGRPHATFNVTTRTARSTSSSSLGGDQGAGDEGRSSAASPTSAASAWR